MEQDVENKSRYTEEFSIGNIIETTPYDITQEALQRFFEERLGEQLIIQKKTAYTVSSVADSIGGGGREVKNGITPNELESSRNNSDDESVIKRHIPSVFLYSQPPQKPTYSSYSEESANLVPLCVTPAEMKIVKRMQANGLSPDIIQQLLRESTPKTNHSTGKGKKKCTILEEDSKAFQCESDYDVEREKLIAKEILEKATVLQNIHTTKCGKRIRSKTKDNKEAPYEKKLSDFPPPFRPCTTMPRYLCLAGNESLDPKVKTKTEIRHTINPLRYIQSLNEIKQDPEANEEQQNQTSPSVPMARATWFPCLFIAIPPNIRNATLIHIEDGWRETTRRIHNRTSMGIHIARAIAGDWFIGEKLNNVELYPSLQTFFRSQTLFIETQFSLNEAKECKTSRK